MVSNELVTETKAILHNLSRANILKTIIAIGNGVLSLRCSKKFTNNCKSVTLTRIWAQGILNLLDWTKRRRTKAKRKLTLALYEELIFT